MAKPSGVIAQLKEAIAKSGLNRNQLQKATGVDRGAIGRFLEGERNLSLPAVEKLCEALRLRLVPEGKGK